MMKKIAAGFLMAFIMALLVPTRIFASDTELKQIRMGDDIIGTYNEDHSILTVSGTGEMWPAQADTDECGYDNYKVDNSVEQVIFDGNITKIASGAFRGTNLTSVVIPDTVTEIEDHAFADCSQLKMVDLGSSVQTMAGDTFDNTNLEELTLSDNLQTMGSGGCISVSRLNIGESAYVGDGKGQNCLGYIFGGGDLETITVAEDNSVYDVVDGVLVSEDHSVIFLYPGANQAETYTLPDTVNEIASYAFCGAEYLKSIELNSALNSIQSYAFTGCVQLEQICLTKGLRTIGENAFYGCEKLAVLNIGENAAESIKKTLGAAFQGSGLQTVQVSKSNSMYSVSKNVLFSKDRTELILYPGALSAEEYKFPSTVTKIANYAFCRAKYLKYVTFDTALKTIGKYAFSRTRLKTVTITDKVDKIYDYAFSYCNSLKKVICGKNLRVIADGAFYWCEKLSGVTLNEKLEKIEDDAFFNCNISTLKLTPNIKKIDKYAFSLANVKTLSVGKCAADLAAGFGFSGLTKITVSSSNEAYTVKDNVLYNKSMTKLVLYPCGRTDSSFTIPKSVKYLGKYAMNGSHLKTVTVTGGLKSFGYNSIAQSAIRKIVLKSKTVVPAFDTNWNGTVQTEYIWYDYEGEYIHFDVPSKTIAKALKKSMQSAGTWTVRYKIDMDKKTIYQGQGKVIYR